MSSFLGANAGTGASGSLRATDDSVMPVFHRWTFPDRTQMRPWDDGLLWSSPAFLGGGGGWALEQNGGSSGNYDSYGPDERGGQQQLKIRGVTRDSSGNPLGGAIVRGYVTATNAFVGQCTSDSGGYYELPTPFVGANHYIVAYQAGSPDVSGSSVNTLTPS